MDYISEYELKFKVVNEHLFGALVGDGGKHQRQFEKEMGVKLVISKESKTVQLSGESIARVKDAEKKVVNIMSNHSFKAEVGNSFAGQILGHNGEKIIKFRKETNASFGISNFEGSTQLRTVEIIGRRPNFMKAKLIFLDEVEELLKHQFAVDNPQRCFRKIHIAEGKQKARYVKNQLPPNPQLIFIQFKTELLDREKLFEGKLVDKTRKIPPRCLNKNGALLAPYEGELYRAKCLSIKRSKDRYKIELKVRFVDYGNESWVDYFACENLPNEYLYPPEAVACQIENIVQKDWNTESLKVFDQYLNNHTRNLQVKVARTANADELVYVYLSLREVGDIGDLLVGHDLAEWKDSPLEPAHVPITNESLIGSMAMLYVKGGYGGCVRIDASSKPRNQLNYNEKKLINTSHFETETMLDSLDSAYICAKKFLESYQNKLFLGFKSNSDFFGRQRNKVPWKISKI